MVPVKLVQTQDDFGAYVGQEVIAEMGRRLGSANHADAKFPGFFGQRVGDVVFVVGEEIMRLVQHDDVANIARAAALQRVVENLFQAKGDEQLLLVHGQRLDVVAPDSGTFIEWRALAFENAHGV